MDETDYHMALYLCREMIMYLEELREVQETDPPGMIRLVKDQAHLSMTSDQMMSALKGLQSSIEVQDVESMLKYEDLIDELVDYFGQLIDRVEIIEKNRRGDSWLLKLKAWRESAGKLAQLLCQIDG